MTLTKVSNLNRLHLVEIDTVEQQQIQGGAIPLGQEPWFSTLQAFIITDRRAEFVGLVNASINGQNGALQAVGPG